MLVIKNIENTENKEFSLLGNEWILYGVDTTSIEYRFVFIPIQAGRHVHSKRQLVMLDRVKRRIGRNVLGYRLWTTDGKHCYIDAKDIPLWTRLIEIIHKNRMIC